METFPFRLVTPEGVMFDTPIWQISACNSLGWFAIRAHHAEFFTSLKSGTLELAISPQNRKQVQIGSGFLEFRPDRGCTVICENNPDS